jgi:mRNA interferase RelE/StbE
LFSAQVLKRSRLPKSVQQILQRKILVLANGEQLTGVKKRTNRNEYRLRSGDYRILFTIDKSTILNIAKIGHRKDVYE